MIYLFYGSDSEKARRQAFAFVAAARKKEPELTYLRLAREELSQSAIEAIAAGNSLFAKRLLVLLDDPFAKARASEDDEGGEESGSSLIEENLALLGDSNNAIIILAPGLLASKAKKLATKAEKEYKFDAKSTLSESKGSFNSVLVNALATRSREKLWLETVRALRAGDAPEQLHGLLHWKARDVLEKRPSPAARALSLDLIKLLQDSRRSGLELPLALERFALSI